MSTIHAILHPTDLSTSSQHAFEIACSLARDQDARVIVLHVLERPVIIQSDVMTPPPPPPPVAERKAAREELARLRPTDPMVRLEHRLEEGDPATGILEVAEEAGCDLIVMGTHGRTGLTRLLAGSVAEKVMRQAPCPVMTVRAPIPSTRT